MAAAGVASMSAPARSASVQSLAAIGDSRGIRFGSALGTRGLTNGVYCRLIQRECASLVCENEMKWRVVRQRDGTYNFRRADAIVAFARRNGMSVRGHTLLFHRALNPLWDAAVQRSGAEAAITNHIGMTIGHFGTNVTSWDVVNEPIDPNGARSDRLRQSPFLAALGPAYIDVAFERARQVAPTAELVLNDWVAPYRPPFFRDHRYAMLRLLERLNRSDVPIDALGIQAHLVAARQDIDVKAWQAFLDDVAALGLRILITEFDVADSRLPPETTTRDTVVADHAREFLDVTLANLAVTDLLTWGLSDPYSAVRLNHKRADGLANRSLPYDENNQPKPLRSAIAAALAAAPVRSNRTKEPA